MLWICNFQIKSNLIKDVQNYLCIQIYELTEIKTGFGTISQSHFQTWNASNALAMNYLENCSVVKINILTVRSSHQCKAFSEHLYDKHD